MATMRYIKLPSLPFPPESVKDLRGRKLFILDYLWVKFVYLYNLIFL